MALYFGSAWYPEHWQEDRWIEDVRLMRDAHMNVVRVAEYAWSRLEPDDNHFDFDWLDRAIDLAITHGMKVVLGTPTNSPPAWVIHKYPDTLQISPEGRKLSHGGGGASPKKWQSATGKTPTLSAGRSITSSGRCPTMPNAADSFRNG
jgi:beta-galactosidase GanA